MPSHTSPPPSSTTTTWATWVTKSPATPIWDMRSLRPTPNRMALGTAAMNLVAIMAPSRTRVMPEALALLSPRWTIEERNGASTAVMTTASRPDTEKNTDPVRMTLASPAWSPSAVMRAVRCTMAVDTPTSRSDR